MFQTRLATLIQAGGLGHVVPTGPAQNVPDVLTADLLKHVIARGDQRVIDVLQQVRIALDESGSSSDIHRDAIDEVIQSGLLLALLEIEDNENIYSGSSASLMQHSTARIASRIGARALLTETGSVRLQIVGALKTLGFQCKGVRFPKGHDGLYVTTEKGDIFVSEYHSLNWFN